MKGGGGRPYFFDPGDSRCAQAASGDMEQNQSRSAQSDAASSGMNQSVTPLPTPDQGASIPEEPGAGVPVTPLPTPDQGTAIPEEPEAGVPVIPLPTPDQGTAIPEEPGAGVPVIPLPNPGEGGPVWPGPDAGVPVIPLPTPDQGTAIPPSGGTVYPGGGIQILPGGSRYASTRFLHAAYGYPAFRIFVGSGRAVNFLSYGSVSSYVNLTPGYRTVTVSGTDGYIYIQKTLPFEAGSVSTVAVVNRAGGLDLVKIPDICCTPARNMSNFRVSNLAYNSGALDVLLADGRVIYADVRFKETTSYKRIVPGAYEFLFAETNQLPAPAYTDIETLDSAFIGMNPLPSTVASLYINVRPNANYTVYLLQNGQSYNAVGTMVVIDR